MAKRKQRLVKSGQRNASEPIRHGFWHKNTNSSLKSARRDSAVLLDRFPLLYDKQAISVKLSESSWCNILLNVSLLEFRTSAKKFTFNFSQFVRMILQNS